jgi:hypothetical protein
MHENSREGVRERKREGDRERERSFKERESIEDILDLFVTIQMFFGNTLQDIEEIFAFVRDLSLDPSLQDVLGSEIGAPYLDVFLHQAIFRIFDRGRQRKRSGRSRGGETNQSCCRFGSRWVRSRKLLTL